MKIEGRTPYKKFAPIEQYVSDESKKAMMAAAERAFKPCCSLTIDEFFGVCGGDYSLLGDTRNPSVLQVYWAKRFAVFVEEFTQACQRTMLEPTPDQRIASEGQIEMTPQEHMLVFVREYFNLPSFFAAGKRTLGEYLTARKDRYNQMLQQRKFEQLQRDKLHKK